MDRRLAMNSAILRSAQVVDFDEAMLDACSPTVRSDLLGEALLLAQAFAPEGCADQLIAMAKALSSGARDSEMDRQHARRLAAALRRLARRGQA
jgi:hypothetical protein